MHHCPSKRRLLEPDHVEPYPDYCDHCPALYSRILEPLGYEYDMDMSGIEKAQCSLVVRRKR